MRYRDLKQERDDAIARALEAERLSMKSEFDRVTAEFEQEKAALIARAEADARKAYLCGFYDGVESMAQDISKRLELRKGSLMKVVSDYSREIEADGNNTE